MAENNENNTSLIQTSSTGLIRVGKSIEITNKIICEFEERLLQGAFPTVKIGKQQWMLKNLNVDKFRNGDSIPEAKTIGAWEDADHNEQPVWCYYENDIANGSKYGKLYNYYAVNDIRGLAPAGYHIASDAEWTVLSDYLGGDAGTKMKSTYGWKNDSNGNNESGFSGLPGGMRYPAGAFDLIGSHGKWWTSTENRRYDAWCRFLKYDGANVGRYIIDKAYMFSVRCIMDNLI